MEKQSLYIKRLDSDGSESLFPASALPVKIGTFEYNAQRMGSAPTITAEFYYPRCLDDDWTYKEYVEFNGERFYVSQVPSSSKSNTDQRYKHEVTLTSARAVLENIYAYDVVTDSTESQYADRYRNNTTTFSFYGDINEFVSRINDSLVYSGVLAISYDSEGNRVYDGYHVVVDDGVETDSLEVSFEDLKITEALQEIYNVYELTYYWDGETCHVGTALHEVDTVLSYGKGNGLLSVEKTNDNNQLVDRVTGYGGETNLQYYYPNQSSAGTALYTLENVSESDISGINLAQIIKYCPSYENVTFTLCHNSGEIVTYNSLSDFTLYDEDETVTSSADITIPTTKMSSAGTYTFSTHISAKIPESSYVYLVWMGLDYSAAFTIFASSSDVTDKCSLYLYLIPFSSDVPSTAAEAAKSYTELGTADGYKVISGSYRLVIYAECTFTFTSDDFESFGSAISASEVNFTLSGTIALQYVDEADKCTFSYGDGGTVSYESSGIAFNDVASLPCTGSTFSITSSGITETVTGGDDAAKVTITGREWMTVSSKLMPSIYRETLGADRFYPAVNYPTSDGGEDDRYIIPDTEDYYVFKNEYESGNPHEAITEDSDIYPTIKNVYNSAGELIAEVVEFAYDEDDNDNLTDDSDEDNPTYIHSYFYAKLRIFNGDYGFNLFKQALYDEEAYLTLTGGNCSSCSFQIAVEKEQSEDGLSYVFYNPVLTDDDGNLLKQGVFEPEDATGDENGYLGDYILPIAYKSQYADRQQDTSKYEVWVALKKDNDTFGVVMPNALNSYYPSAGDSFVLTGVGLPQVYIDAAERKLDEYLIQYMSENNEESFSYEVTFSRNWIARNEETAAKINENALITIEYNGTQHQLFVSSYTCKADDNILYEISVELSEELTLQQSTLRSEIEGLKGSKVTSTSGSSSSSTSGSYSGEATSLSDDVLDELKELFLSKTDADTASGVITFLKGLLTAADVASADFNESTQTGFSISKTDSGKWKAFFTNMEIWGKAVFNELEIRELSSVGGNIVLSPASSRIVAVEEYSVDGVMVGWKCYYLADDGTTATQNNWEVGDQARCQSFDIDEGVHENVGNKDYWRCVIAVSTENEEITDDDGNVLYDGQLFGWVVLSLTNAQASDYGSTYTGADWDEDYAYLSTPAANDAIVLMGHQIQDDDSSDETSRMNLIILSSSTDEPRILMYQGVYTFSLDDRLTAQIAPSGILFRSESLQWISEGVTVPNYVNMGEWTDGCTAGQYTIWYYNGDTWRWDGEESTTSEPSEENGWVRLTYNSTTELTRMVVIEQSLGGQMYYDETETVTLSVWDVARTTDYTSGYTFSVERDSGDDSSDAVWNAAFAANYDGGNTFTITFSDLNFVDGSRTTKFWVYATETESGDTLEEEVIEY